MTREKAAEIWHIIKAYGEGKTIQIKDDDGWQDCKEPSFMGNEYRIKPEECMRKSFEEGKQLQVKTTDGWIDIVTREAASSSTIEWDKHEFRIKPTEKNYRPFEDTAELMVHYSKHFNIDFPPFYEPIIWIKRKQTCELSPDIRFLITGYDESCVHIGEKWIDTEELFHDYIFLDGSCCGKVVE